jgi:hypothetical protein
MSIPAERLAHKKNGKFQCITCGNRKPWRERMPKTERIYDGDGKTIVYLEFAGYECPTCISDSHAASHAAMMEKFEKKGAPR